MPIAKNRDEPGQDGTVRKAHYGAGKQPWDTMVEKGWAVHFAAGTVLRYLRRDKEPEHSLESARWYFARLREMSEPVYMALIKELTADELKLLKAKT